MLRLLKRIKTKLEFVLAKDAYEVAKFWRKRGVVIGENTAIYKTVRFGNGGADPITIGDNCTLTGCTILGHDASTNFAIGLKSGEPSPVSRVVIENDCFIGFGSIVLMGSRIGEGSIIGAGAIVRGDVPPDSIMAGNPAVRVGSASELADKRKNKRQRLPV